LICTEGEIQLTQADRNKMVETKRKQIINYIHKGWVDPKTKKPHSIVMIDNALTSIKARIDMEKSVEEQVKSFMKELVVKLPLSKIEQMEGVLIIPTKFVGQVQGFLRNHCTVMGEKWVEDGCQFTVSLSSSDYDVLIQNVTKATQGDFNFDVPSLNNSNNNNSSSSSEPT